MRGTALQGTAFRRIGGLRPGRTLRGRIVVRYLAVLGALLLVSAAFQYAALRGFLVRAAAGRLVQEGRNAVFSVRQNQDPEALARAAGGPFTAAWVIGPAGQTLASAVPPRAAATWAAVPAPTGPGVQVTGDVLIVRIPVVPSRAFRHRFPFGPAGRPGPGPASGTPAGGATAVQPTASPATAQPTASPATAQPALSPTADQPSGASPADPTGGRRPPPSRRAGGAALGTLVIATPLDNVQGVLAAEIRLLLLGGVGALVVAGLVGAWVLGRGLRPLETIAGTADAVAGGELAQRAAVDGAPQEVARVGRAFNTMLDRLSAALAEEQQARERMRRFLADASHELRTPVTAIVGFLEVLRAGAARDPATLERSLVTVHAQAQRMANLVDRLLSLVRFDQPTPLHLAEVDLGAWLEDLWPELESATAGHPLRRGAPEDPGPFQARADADALGRALLNLVENAAKYSPAATPITVSLDREDGRLRVSVSDAGPGIPADELPHVFERFRRGRGAQDARVPGTGLGLAIVRAVATAHGGDVELTCPPGGGTRAAIRLPASP